MTLVALFRRALAAISIRIRRAAPPALNMAPGTRGRRLFDSPAFQDLMREHAAHRAAVPRMADLLSGEWWRAALINAKYALRKQW
jgi:hypothetical protein